MNQSTSMRELLIEQLEGKHAHADFSQAVQGLTFKQAGIKVEGVPYTIWELIEHIRIAQEDILEFCSSPHYEEIDWPDDYWPESPAPESKAAFNNTIHAIKDGMEEMRELIRDEENDLFKLIPHGSGQTLFREALLIMDHNAYHIGQIILIRKMLGSW